MLIKSEPDREYTQHVLSDDNLPAVREEKLHIKEGSDNGLI